MEILVQPLQRRITVRPGANLLEALREHQIPVSYSCTAGRCGTCRCKILEGEVLESGHNLVSPLAGEDAHVLACQTFLTEPCTIQIPEPDEVVVHPARLLKGIVERIDDLAHDVKRLCLRTNRPLGYSPGQYAQLQFGVDLVRPYSMAGLHTDDCLEFHVRVVPGGRVSGHINSALRIGDAVRVSGPMGSAYLRRHHDGPMLCVAGGTGLAPILSIVRGAVAEGMRNPIHLYFGVRSERDLYGLDELHALSASHPALRVNLVVSSGGRSGCRQGLVTDAIAEDWKQLDGWRTYLCGSPPMVEAATRMVRQKGVPTERIYADAFYSTTA